MRLLENLTPLAALQVALEFWGALLAILTQFTYRHTSVRESFSEKNRLLSRAVLAAIAGIVFDILALLFRGYPGRLGYWLVRVVNFCCFFANFCLLWAFLDYLRAHFTAALSAGTRALFTAARVLLALVTALLILNLFTGWCYQFDDANRYYRSSLYLPLVAVPTLVFGLIIFILLREREALGGRHFTALLTFIVFPVIAIILTIFIYGFSFITISVILSLLIVQESHRFSTIQQNILLQHDASTDMLTGLKNRRAMDHDMIDAFHQMIEEEKPLGICIFDIDFFKEVNDTYGHQKGDEYLITVAKVVQQICNAYQGVRLYRYGGDEYLLIFERYSDRELLNITDEMRQTVADLKIPNEKSANGPYVSISLGIKNKVPKLEDSLFDYMHDADMALYRVKEEARGTSLLVN